MGSGHFQTKLPDSISWRTDVPFFKPHLLKALEQGRKMPISQIIDEDTRKFNYWVQDEFPGQYLEAIMDLYRNVDQGGSQLKRMAMKDVDFSAYLRKNWAKAWREYPHYGDWDEIGYGPIRGGTSLLTASSFIWRDSSELNEWMRNAAFGMILYFSNPEMVHVPNILEPRQAGVFTTQLDL